MTDVKKIFKVIEECQDRSENLKKGEVLKCTHNLPSEKIQQFEQKMKDKGFNTKTTDEKIILSVDMYGNGIHDYKYTYQGVTYISLPTNFI